MEIENKNVDLNEEKYLFDKEVVCPICGNKFKVSVVKSDAYRTKCKDSDLYVNYSLINPYFYEVWLCNKCGYASMKSDFEKIKKHEIEIIVKEISPKWSSRNYPKIFNVNIAIERFKLSLLNNSIIGSKSSRIAMNCLKLAWMYRLLGDVDIEQSFLKQALKEFNEAYFKEDFPLYGMDRFTTMYLIGELHRRTGNDTEALLQFSNVITNPSAGRKLKDLAITQKDLIRAKAEAAVAEEDTKNNFTENKEKKGIFSRFFK